MMTPPMPAITALYAGLIGLLLLVLAVPISRKRMALRVGLGDGGDAGLARAIRVHANTVEWAVPALLLLLLAELTRAPLVLLHVAGIALIIGRLLHASGLSRSAGASRGRFSGTLLTWGVIAVLGVWNVWAFVRTLLV
jgi:uncharacterized membrane protein YecN with MAPEG domain